MKEVTSTGMLVLYQYQYQHHYHWAGGPTQVAFFVWGLEKNSKRHGSLRGLIFKGKKTMYDDSLDVLEILSVYTSPHTLHAEFVVNHLDPDEDCMDI